MTVIATALKHMLAAGMPHEAIIVAVAEMEATVAMAAPVKQRSKAALRQERYAARERQKTSGNVSADDQMTVSDEKASGLMLPDAVPEDSPPLPPPPPSFPQTPNQPPPPPAPPCGDASAREAGLFGDDTEDNQPTAKPKKGKKVKSGDEPFELPTEIPADAWAGFEEMRTRLRKPMTDRARRGMVKRLKLLAEDGHPPGDVLDQSTLNSWTDVYALKDRRNGTGNRNSTTGQNGSDFRDPVLADLAYGVNS